MESAYGQAEVRGDPPCDRKAVRTIEASAAYPAHELGFAGAFGHQYIADLLADFGGDRVCIRAGQIENVGVEVPLHPVGGEVDRTIEHALVVTPMHGSRERK